MCVTTALTLVNHSHNAHPLECLQFLRGPRYILPRWLPMLSTLQGKERRMYFLPYTLLYLGFIVGIYIHLYPLTRIPKRLR